MGHSGTDANSAVCALFNTFLLPGVLLMLETCSSPDFDLRRSLKEVICWQAKSDSNSSNYTRRRWRSCENKMAAKPALSSLHQRLWSSGGSGSMSRGERGGRPRQWQIWRSGTPHPCVLSTVLLLYSHNGPAGLSLTSEGRGCSVRPRRPTVRREAEIKDGQSLAGLLHCTQQAEVITHMGGADCMTSWWNLSVLLCCKNNAEACNAGLRTSSDDF